MKGSGTLHVLSRRLVIEALQKGYITACLLAVHKAVATTVEGRIDAIIRAGLPISALIISKQEVIIVLA